MAIEMSRQKHFINSRRDLSYSMIGCILDDSGNLINGRKLDRRFLPGIDTRSRWETILPKSPLAASSTFVFSFYGFLCALLSIMFIVITIFSVRQTGVN
jgi:hypothetical protein